MPPSAVLQTLAHFWPLLQSAGVPSAVAGGVALSYWGNPRSTQDVDVAILASDCDPIEVILKEAGFAPKSEQPKELGLFKLLQCVFEPVDEYVTVEIDLLMSASDYYRAAFDRIKPIELDGISVPVAVLSREDLILHKLYAGRLIDQADVATLLEIHWPELDQTYLDCWATKLDLQTALHTAIDRYRESQP